MMTSRSFRTFNFSSLCLRSHLFRGLFSLWLGPQSNRNIERPDFVARMPNPRGLILKNHWFPPRDDPLTKVLHLTAPEPHVDMIDTTLNVFGTKYFAIWMMPSQFGVISATDPSFKLETVMTIASRRCVRHLQPRICIFSHYLSIIYIILRPLDTRTLRLPMVFTLLHSKKCPPVTWMIPATLFDISARFLSVSVGKIFILVPLINTSTILLKYWGQPKTWKN